MTRTSIVCITEWCAIYDQSKALIMIIIFLLKINFLGDSFIGNSNKLKYKNFVIMSGA